MTLLHIICKSKSFIYYKENCWLWTTHSSVSKLHHLPTTVRTKTPCVKRNCKSSRSVSLKVYQTLKHHTEISNTVRQDFPTVEGYHRNNHFIFGHNDSEVNGRNTVFKLQSHLQECVYMHYMQCLWQKSSLVQLFCRTTLSFLSSAFFHSRLMLVWTHWGCEDLNF